MTDKGKIARLIIGIERERARKRKIADAECSAFTAVTRIRQRDGKWKKVNRFYGKEWEQ